MNSEYIYLMMTTDVQNVLRRWAAMWDGLYKTTNDDFSLNIANVLYGVSNVGSITGTRINPEAVYAVRNIAREVSRHDPSAQIVLSWLAVHGVKDEPYEDRPGQVHR